MRVRDLVNMFTSDLSYFISRCEEGNPIEPAPEDKGLPVRGTCEVPVYPIYISPISEQGFMINPLERLATMAQHFLPGEADRVGTDTYFTIAPDLRSWQMIEKDKLPMSAHKEDEMGCFAIWVDNRAPNMNDELMGDVGPLLRDFALRADVKHRYLEDCQKKGFQYIDIGQAAQSAEKAPIMILTRMDCAIEFEIDTCTWRLIDGIPEMSPVNNITQHRTFLTTAKPGRIAYTGEQLAKAVLSVQSGLNIMADRYLESLDSILSLTHYKVTHPIDTRGYFLRKSASTALQQGIPVHAPTVDYFPVFLHDTVLDIYIQISQGLTRIPKASLPPSIEKAGTLCGIYEVLYDTTANDTYTYAQIAWLLKLMMGSQYVTQSEGVTALYGCLNLLNHSIAGVMGIGTIEKLETAEGTRITNLDRATKDSDIPVAFCVDSPYCRVHVYDPEFTSISMVSGHIMSRNESLQVECDKGQLSPESICNMLATIAGSGMFSTWESALSSADDLDIVEAGPGYKAFFSKAPHVYDPYTLTNNPSICLFVEGRVYGVADDGSWCDALVDDGLKFLTANKLTRVGQFFCGELYCRQGGDTDIPVDEQFMRNLFSTTVRYFVPFEKYPRLFDYVYNMDKESGVWTHVGLPASDSRFVFGKENAFAYDNDTHIWTFYPGLNLTEGEGLGPVLLQYPEGMTMSVADLKLMLEALQYYLPTIKYETSLQHSRFMEGPRFWGEECADPQWTILFGGTSYTGVDGDWAIASKTVQSEANIPMTDVASLLLGWVCSFASFRGADSAYQVFAEMLGENFTDMPETAPVADAVICYVDKDLLQGFGEDVPDDVDIIAACINHNNTHGVFANYVSKAPVLPVWQAAKFLVDASSGVQVLLDAVKTGDVEPTTLTRVAEEYKRRVAGRVQKATNEVTVNLAIRTLPLIVFDNEGDIFGYDGSMWRAFPSISDDMVCAGSPFDCGIYYYKDMQGAPVTRAQFIAMFDTLLTVAWQGWNDTRYAYILGQLRTGGLHS